MRCPYCHHDEDRVLDTRNIEAGYLIRRRRLCHQCGRRFVTVEKIERLNIRVRKNNGGLEPLDREKIRRGIETACSKRSIDTVSIEKLIQDIESEIYSRFDDEIPSAQVGELVMRHLARIDPVAYIRFASVYREFDDVQDFIHTISSIEPVDER